MVYMKCNFRRRGVDRIECLLQNQRVTPYLRRCACFPHSIMAGGCHCHSGSSFEYPCRVGLSIRTGSVRFSIFSIFSICFDFFRFSSIFFRFVSILCWTEPVEPPCLLFWLLCAYGLSQSSVGRWHTPLSRASCPFSFYSFRSPCHHVGRLMLLGLSIFCCLFFDCRQLK